VKLREQKITLETFDFAVSQYFEPMAKRFRLSISHLKDGLYEIQSPYYSMRIEYTEGHIGKQILATLFPTKDRPANVEDRVRKYGVGLIAKYNGVDMQTHPVRAVEDFLSQADHIEKMTEKFCVPYFLGQKNDFEQIESYAEGLIEKSGIRKMKWKLPKNAREEWKLPEK
jgi:hypothetical protein